MLILLTSPTVSDTHLTPYFAGIPAVPLVQIPEELVVSTIASINLGYC